ncbi:follistatin-related protein 5 [Galendromus occidentalis]|uniref:Follistatin-related protein 5 n=1 Tax=Galendromus occidentalis TaxID=34638 RepID=A0AAJ7L3Y0_9ACAR|nr:follistatin-related protein 5 [Galendromus occidentalis]
MEPESGSLEDQECCQQDYDFMKENLLLFYSKNGEVKRLGGSDSLMASMFAHYDTNADNYLQGEELWKASEDDKMSQLSQACILADMLLFDDVDKDGKLSVAEFYGAFNKLDSEFLKKLEVAIVQARVGDNVEIKCDVTGSPPPPIVWRRNGFDLNALNEEEIKVFVDGSLYLTNVQLVHSGNYTCHAQKNLNIVQTHVLHIHTLPEVHVIPRIQSRAPGELAEMECHVTGVPVPKVKWLKNDEDLKMLADKYTIVGNGTALMVSKITYSDTGAYMCVASSPAGSSRDISSLVVQDEPAPSEFERIPFSRRFFAFHDWGISVYDPDNCRLYHQVQSVDIIPGTQENLCAERGHPCSWGRAINVADRYVYVSQPTKGRVLVISRVQMVVVDVVVTDKFPVELYYVPHLDQLWVLCWRGPVDRGTKTIQIIRDASQKKKHHTVHPEPVDGHFDLVSSLFIPSTSDLGFPWKYGYVVHSGQNGLSKMDLRAMKYVKTIEFANITCHPIGADFAALGGFIVVSCMDPDTGSANGQLVLDYLTDEVVSFKATLLGKPHVSPDSQYVVTLHSPSDKEKNSSNDITIVVQAVTDSGLHFLFDVKTTLRIADLTFFSSRTSHSYDLYASSSNKEDILLVNLQDGKVEMITGIGRAIDPRSSEWGNSRRPIASAGIFGTYMVTSANEAVFVINGKTRTVNCEIGNVVHPRLLVWVRSP